MFNPEKKKSGSQKQTNVENIMGKEDLNIESTDACVLNQRFKNKGVFA